MSFRLLYKIASYLLKRRRPYLLPKTNYSSTNVKPKSKPPYETCRKKKRLPDPDLSTFEGKPFRTCGTAYIIQRDMIPTTSLPERGEDAILRKIEADLTLKNQTVDPMPPFQSVEKRLIDLCERGLHPFYKRYLSMPRKKSSSSSKTENEEEQIPIEQYQCRNGPITVDALPKQLKINRSLLERKSIYEDYKTVELPRQMVARMMEIESNRKPTLEKKVLKRVAGKSGSCSKENE